MQKSASFPIPEDLTVVAIVRVNDVSVAYCAKILYIIMKNSRNIRRTFAEYVLKIDCTKIIQGIIYKNDVAG